MHSRPPCRPPNGERGCKVDKAVRGQHARRCWPFYFMDTSCPQQHRATVSAASTSCPLVSAALAQHGARQPPMQHDPAHPRAAMTLNGRPLEPNTSPHTPTASNAVSPRPWSTTLCRSGRRRTAGSTRRTSLRCAPPAMGGRQRGSTAVSDAGGGGESRLCPSPKDRRPLFARDIAELNQSEILIDLEI